MIRRQFLQTGAAALGVSMSAKAVLASSGSFEVNRSKSEWKALLTSAEYEVMREEATERAFSSPLDTEKRAGMFHCKGCDLAVYSSSAKYDSGTGWPSFWKSQSNAIGTKRDRKLFSVRTEVHCRRCGSHFGHIFDDGPQPTGKRHCLNGVSLKFRAA